MKDKTSASEAGRAQLGVNGHLGHCWDGANSEWREEEKENKETQLHGLPVTSQNLPQTHFLSPGLSLKHPVKGESRF